MENLISSEEFDASIKTNADLQAQKPDFSKTNTVNQQKQFKPKQHNHNVHNAPAKNNETSQPN